MILPINFTSDQGGSIRTLIDGVVVGWKSAEDRRRFEGYVQKNVARLLGKPYDPAKPPLDLTPFKFQTGVAYNEFTDSFPATRGQIKAVTAALAAIGVDVDALVLDFADEEGDPVAPPPGG